nr:isochorismatase family protein [Bacteroidales bacterium]
TEYCVRNTAEDLLKAGYKVSIPETALACVDEDGHVEAIAAMKAEGIDIY